MNVHSTRSMSEGAMMCALTVVLALLNRFSGFLLESAFPLDLCVSHADLRCPLWVSHCTAAGVLRVSVRPVLLFLDLAVLSGERTFAGGALWRLLHRERRMHCCLR